MKQLSAPELESMLDRGQSEDQDTHYGARVSRYFFQPWTTLNYPDYSKDLQHETRR